MQRIIFVMPTFGAGGAEISLLMLLHLLAEKDDVQVDLLLFKQEGMYIEQLPNNIRVLLPDNSLRAAYAPFSLKNFKTLKGALISIIRPISTAIAALLSRFCGASRGQLRWIYCYKYLLNKLTKEYDYACGYLDGEATYYVVDNIQAKKKFGWNHNDYKGMDHLDIIDSTYYEKLDKIITISDRCNSILQEVFPQFSHKMMQIPNIVLPGYLDQRATLFYPAEYESVKCPKILSVGRLTEQKGFDMAIDAAALLKRKGIDFCWFIIGTGHLQDALQKQIDMLGLNDNVKLLGQRTNPYPYISNADLFLQPSRFEGKSIVLTEAKLLCKPIIATRYATVLDLLTDRVNGILSDMNAESISAAIEELLGNESLCNLLCSNLNAQRQIQPKEAEENLALFGLS